MGCCTSSSDAVQPSMDKSPVGQRDTDAIQIQAGTFVTQSSARITDSYNLGKVLGQGAYGKCVLATNKVTGANRAVKIIDKTQLSATKEEKKTFFDEVELLKTMNHPNILKIYEFHEDERKYYIVTDYCQGGELFDYMSESNGLSQKVVARIIFQLLWAIQYWHDKRIVHRDIKPENILLDSKDKKNPMEISIKIIDFGTSWLIKSNQKLSKKIGTAYYVAPEVLNGNYNHKIDIWSIGVIAYILLAGYPPFNGQTDQKILEKVKKMEYEFDPGDWDSISDDAKDLISKCLKPMNQRLTAQEALQHPWIQNANQTDTSPDLVEKSLKSLASFNADRKLQRAVLTFITTQLTDEEQNKEIKQQFQALDKNNDGKISREELMEAYTNQIGAEAASDEVDRIMTQVDTDGSGYIDYSEFVTAQASRSTTLSKENLERAFNMFDKDGSGTISAKELRNVLGEQPGDIWNKIMSEIDEDRSGEIDLKEFIQAMLKEV